MVEEEIKDKSVNIDSNVESKGETPNFPMPEEPEEEDKIALANKAAERIEKANAERRKLLDRWERLEANRIASGTATAGEKKEVKEETPKEYAKRIMEGKI